MARDDVTDEPPSRGSRQAYGGAAAGRRPSSSSSSSSSSASRSGSSPTTKICTNPAHQMQIQSQMGITNPDFRRLTSFSNEGDMGSAPPPPSGSRDAGTLIVAELPEGKGTLALSTAEPIAKLKDNAFHPDHKAVVMLVRDNPSDSSVQRSIDSGSVEAVRQVQESKKPGEVVVAVDMDTTGDFDQQLSFSPSTAEAVAPVAVAPPPPTPCHHPHHVGQLSCHSVIGGIITGGNNHPWHITINQAANQLTATCPNWFGTGYTWTGSIGNYHRMCMGGNFSVTASGNSSYASSTYNLTFNVNPAAGTVIMSNPNGGLGGYTWNTWNFTPAHTTCCPPTPFNITASCPNYLDHPCHISMSSAGSITMTCPTYFGATSVWTGGFTPQNLCCSYNSINVTLTNPAQGNAQLTFNKSTRQLTVYFNFGNWGTAYMYSAHVPIHANAGCCGHAHIVPATAATTYGGYQGYVWNVSILATSGRIEATNPSWLGGQYVWTGSFGPHQLCCSTAAFTVHLTCPSYNSAMGGNYTYQMTIYPSGTFSMYSNTNNLPNTSCVWNGSFVPVTHAHHHHHCGGAAAPPATRTARELEYRVTSSKGDVTTDWTKLPHDRIPTSSNKVAPLRVRGAKVDLRYSGTPADKSSPLECTVVTELPVRGGVRREGESLYFGTEESLRIVVDLLRGEMKEGTIVGSVYPTAGFAEQRKDGTGKVNGLVTPLLEASSITLTDVRAYRVFDGPLVSPDWLGYPIYGRLRHEILDPAPYAEEKRDYVMRFRRKHLPEIRFAVFGPAGAGKSTCLSGLMTCFAQHKVDFFFAAGGYDRVTRERKEARLMRRCKVFLVDWPGFQPGVNYKNLRQVSQAVDGRVPLRLLDFDLDLPEHDDLDDKLTPNAQLKLKDRMHVPIIVLQATEVINAASADTAEVKRVLPAMRDRPWSGGASIPLVALTMLDEADPHLKEHPEDLPRSERIYRAVVAASEKLGIPIANIFPIYQYHDLSDNNDIYDLLYTRLITAALHKVDDMLMRLGLDDDDDDESDA